MAPKLHIFSERTLRLTRWDRLNYRYNGFHETTGEFGEIYDGLNSSREPLEHQNYIWSVWIQPLKAVNPPIC